jgi:hypothetical protein
MPVKCEKAILNPTDARTIKITGGTKTIVSHKYKDKIVSLEFPDGTVISLEQTITVKKRPYKVNIIKKTFVGNTLVYELSVAEKTKSTLFALPMLGGERRLFFYDNLLINCFIGTPDHEGCIALLYRWSGDPLFLKFENALKQFGNYLDSYDVSETLIMFVFDIPTKHIENYKSFISGKYSEFNSAYKTKILKFHGMDINSQLAQIMYKSEKRKKRLETTLNVTLDENAELYSILDKKQEIFDPNYYL